MIFNAKLPLDQQRAVEKLKYFLKKGCRFELTEKRENRTLRQNNYLHLILSWFALEYGETLEYTKQVIFKQHINPDLFVTEYVNRKTGEMRSELKSTADLDTKQMTDAIDRFRNFASKEMGIYLPEPNDLALLNEIEREIENHKQYL